MLIVYILSIYFLSNGKLMALTGIFRRKKIAPPVSQVEYGGDAWQDSLVNEAVVCIK